MLFDIMLPSQMVIPLGVALSHLALALYIIIRRRFSSYIFSRLFQLYLLLTILWNINLLIIAAGNLSLIAPGPQWRQLASYGLMLLGVTFWAFARSFLERPWKAPHVWGIGLIGLIGLALAVSFNMRWLLLPDEIVVWSQGRLHARNINFVLGGIIWAIFMGLTLLTIQIQLFQTQNPAHKNRVRYLLISTLFLLIGYGMYLSQREITSTAGLIITWFGSTLAGYVVGVENLIDLGIAARRVISRVVITLVTIAVYIAGIYLVQIFLGDFLTSLFISRFLDPILLVAAVTAVLLTIVYVPINRIGRRLTNRILFGQRYNYPTVIQNYTQAISNILYLDELATVALLYIKQELNIEEGILFLLDAETSKYLHFRTLPKPVPFRFPEALTLTQDTPILHRLLGEGQPLSQYTLDISPHFKDTPEAERAVMKSLNLEWFIPILKQKQLIGIFGLGSKRSKQRYVSQDIRLLITLADQTALALENAILFDRLHRTLEETTHMKNLMDNVFDSMDNGVVTVDLEDKITFCNKAAEVILQLPQVEDCVGRPYKQALAPLANTIFPNLVANVLKYEQRYADYEIVTFFPERGRVNLNVTLAPLKNAQNKTHGVTMVIDDLTETKHLQAVRDMFKRYVSPAVVDRLPADPSELELGGHRQEITVLFADIRGFTQFSEKMAPEKLVDILNEYLSMAATSILMYEGMLDKFMGDAVMGIFNAPLDQEDHVLRAVRAAVAMQRAIAEYHHNIGQERELSFGIGLHVGEAVVGNVGMSDRMDYTAVGDTVNLAKRIQENSPGNKILISEDVYRVVSGSFELVFYQELKVKGREQPVKTYELVWT
jgi:PAS domain S-box-containing protein